MRGDGQTPRPGPLRQIGRALAGFALGTVSGVVGLLVGFVVQGSQAALAVGAAVGVVVAGLVLRRRRAALVGILGAVVLLVLALLPARVAVPPSRPVNHWDVPSGARLAYVKVPARGSATGPPVVALHGGPGTSSMNVFEDYFSRLGLPDQDVYIYDEAGAGRSSRLARPMEHDVLDDVADLEAVRALIGAPTVVLVGHSYGGYLAAAYAAQYPDRVARLLLVSPGALDPDDRSGSGAKSGMTTKATLRLYARALSPRPLTVYGLTQLDLERAHRTFGDPEPDAINDELLALSADALHCRPGETTSVPPDPTGYFTLQAGQPNRRDPVVARRVVEGLHTFHGAALVVKGSCDYLSWDSAVEYRRTLPDAHLTYVEGAGHNVFDEYESTAPIVREFVAEGRVLRELAGNAMPVGYRGPEHG